MSFLGAQIFHTYCMHFIPQTVALAFDEDHKASGEQNLFDSFSQPFLNWRRVESVQAEYPNTTLQYDSFLVKEKKCYFTDHIKKFNDGMNLDMYTSM